MSEDKIKENETADYAGDYIVQDPLNSDCSYTITVNSDGESEYIYDPEASYNI